MNIAQRFESDAVCCLWYFHFCNKFLMLRLGSICSDNREIALPKSIYPKANEYV